MTSGLASAHHGGYLLLALRWHRNSFSASDDVKPPDSGRSGGYRGGGRRRSLDDEEDDESTPLGAGVAMVGAAHSNSSVDKLPSDHRQNVRFFRLKKQINCRKKLS